MQIRSRWRAAHRACFLAAILSGLTACAGTRPAPETERTIAQAAGVVSPIILNVQGGPLDEPPGGDGHLSLANAVERAVTTDPGLQAAMARVQMAIADADQARLWPNPILNVALRFPEQGGTAVMEASLAQDIISILRQPRQASAADNRMRQAAADALTVALDVASEVQERYAGVQALDALMPVLLERRDLLSKVVDVAQARLQAQEGTRDDLVLLQTQMLEVELDTAERQRELRDERLQLARLIGEPSSPAEWTLDPWSSATAAPVSEADWIDAALQHRPEIQAITWQLAALQDDQALTGFLAFDGAEAGVAAEREEDWSVGPEISVPIPIFDMGQARKARVTAEQIEARHLLTQAKRRVVEDVRRAHESHQGAQANLLRVRGELVPLLQNRRSQAEALFRAGERDATTMFLAEQDLQSAAARAVELEREATIALVRLQRTVGGAGVVNQITHESAESNAIDPATHRDVLAGPASGSPGAVKEAQ